MKYHQIIAAHYKVTSGELLHFPKIPCPQCKTDLAEESTVIRRDSKGGDKYAWGYYETKIGEFEPDPGERQPEWHYGFTEHCGHCDKELAWGDGYHHYKAYKK